MLPWLVPLEPGRLRRSSSVVIIWAALCPLVSLLVEDLRRTLLWIVGFVLLLIISAFLQPHLTPAELPEALITRFFVLNLGAVIAIAFALLYYFVGQRNFFQQRSETLLLNILPKEISEALKTDRSAIARRFVNLASVLFADIVEFTPMAATMPPLHLVNLLNDVFQCFDDLVEKHGLEKIKTIGDCCVGGRRRAAPAKRSRDRGRAVCARHTGCRGEPDFRRPQTGIPYRHQHRPCRGGRDRPQEIHFTIYGAQR